MRLHAAALIVVLAGCAGDPIRRIAAPAPQGALACAQRVLVDLGYAVSGGYLEGGHLYFERPPDTLEADLFTVEQSEGELRVFASTRTDRNRHGPPTPESLEHARAVFSTCATSTPRI
jgi:hypothetical protein